MEQTFSFRSFDGVRLEADLHIPESEPVGLAVLIHGVQTTRQENGFYVKMAKALGDIGYASIRADWRCHGVDASRPLTELSLCGVLNDIDAAVCAATARTSDDLPVVPMAASFTGGLAVKWSADTSRNVAAVVLLNPVLDYVDEYIEGQGFGTASSLTEDAIGALESEGHLVSQRKPFSRAAINEIRGLRIAPNPAVKHWILHGDIDTGVNIKTSISFADRYSNAKLLVFPGAEHGFSFPGDWNFETEQTQTNHGIVRKEVQSILSRGESSGDLQLRG